METLTAVVLLLRGKSNGSLVPLEQAATAAAAATALELGPGSQRPLACLRAKGGVPACQTCVVSGVCSSVLRCFGELLEVGKEKPQSLL